MSEIERLRELVRSLVEDRGDVMPGWAIPQGAYDYVCGYCGERADMRFNYRVFMEHKPDCPIGIGQRLIDKFDNDSNIEQGS